MKILIITHNYPVSAGDRQNAGIFVYDFAHELVKYAEVTVFCPGAITKRNLLVKQKSVGLDGLAVKNLDSFSFGILWILLNIFFLFSTALNK